MLGLGYSMKELLLCLVSVVEGYELSCPAACGVLVLGPGIKTTSSALEDGFFYWITRGVPMNILKAAVHLLGHTNKPCRLTVSFQANLCIEKRGQFLWLSVASPTCGLPCSRQLYLCNSYTSIHVLARCSPTLGRSLRKMISSFSVVLNLVRVMELLENRLKSMLLSPGKFNASQSIGHYFRGFLIVCCRPSRTCWFVFLEMSLRFQASALEGFCFLRNSHDMYTILGLMRKLLAQCFGWSPIWLFLFNQLIVLPMDLHNVGLKEHFCFCFFPFYWDLVSPTAFSK